MSGIVIFPKSTVVKVLVPPLPYFDFLYFMLFFEGWEGCISCTCFFRLVNDRKLAIVSVKKDMYYRHCYLAKILTQYDKEYKEKVNIVRQCWNFALLV